MPTVRYLKDMANAGRACDTPEPHCSMVTPPHRVLKSMRDSSKSRNANREGGKFSEEDKKRIRKLEAVLRIRTMRPRTLFNESDIELVTRLAEKRTEIVRVDGLDSSQPLKVRKTGDGNRRKNSAIEKPSVRQFTYSGRNGRTSNTRVLEKDDDGAGRGLNMSEFARLMVLLKDDESCRRAFVDSSQVLNRDQLDRGMRSSDFWTSVVEPAFNNKDNNLKFNCSPVVPDVDPSLPPTAYKTGDQLSTGYKSFRSKFMLWLHRYESSGRNCRDFKEFVMESGLNVETLLGKRIVVGGYIIGVDAVAPDEEFIHAVRRTIGKESEGGYDVKISPNNECLNGKSDLVGCGTRKAKKDYMNGVMQTKFVTALDAITTYYGEKSGQPPNKGNVTSKNQSSKASPVHHPRSARRSAGTSSIGTRSPDIDKLLQKQAPLLDSVAAAREKLHQCGNDNWMAERWQRFITTATERLDEIDEEIKKVVAQDGK